MVQRHCEGSRNRRGAINSGWWRWSHAERQTRSKAALNAHFTTPGSTSAATTLARQFISRSEVNDLNGLAVDRVAKQENVEARVFGVGVDTGFGEIDGAEGFDVDEQFAHDNASTRGKGRENTQ